MKEDASASYVAEAPPPTCSSEDHMDKKEGNKLGKKGAGILHSNWTKLKSCSDSSSRAASAEKAAGKGICIEVERMII